MVKVGVRWISEKLMGCAVGKFQIGGRQAWGKGADLPFGSWLDFTRSA